MSKKGERRAQSPRRPRLPGIKSGPKKDKLKDGYKLHVNAVQGSDTVFIPKVK